MQSVITLFRIVKHAFGFHLWAPYYLVVPGIYTKKTYIDVCVICRIAKGVQ